MPAPRTAIIGAGISGLTAGKMRSPTWRNEVDAQIAFLARHLAAPTATVTG